MVDLVQSTRDRGLTALFEGFFAAAWFGWAQATAPARLGGWLTAGSIVSLLVAAAGAVVAVRAKGTPSAMRDEAAGRRYGIVVGVEFGSAAVGAVALALLGWADYIPVWVCLVVGVHFFALVTPLRDSSLVPLGVLMCAVAVAALVAAGVSDVAPGTVTGIGAGTLLLVFAVIALVRTI